MIPSASEIAAAVGQGRVSALEVLDEYLERVEQRNEKLNAVVVMDVDRARATAAAGPTGPLAGVPFTVKEAITVAGLPARECSLLRPCEIAAEDAAVVGRLRAAGAVLLGTTNTSELCAFPDTVNRVFGATRNPVDPTRSAGGSSGGEGAAVRAGLSAFGLGSDYGGSIRAPAHWCGVAGIRPGAGRVPTTGLLPHEQPRWRAAWTTIGPLARTVADLELVLSVLTGSSIGFAPLPERVYVFVDALGRDVTPDCKNAVDRAAEMLPCDVLEVVPPFQLDAEELFDRVSAAETRSIIESLGSLEHASAQLLAINDAVERAAPIPAHVEDDVCALEMAAAGWLDRHPVLLAPAAACIAPPLGSMGSDLFDAFHHCKLASALGLPAAVVPVSVTDAGLPVGVQVIGRRGHENEVLGVCRAIENAAAPHL